LGTYDCEASKKGMCRLAAREAFSDNISEHFPSVAAILWHEGGSLIGEFHLPNRIALPKTQEFKLFAGVF
jgi:hypothetical protein